MSLENKINFISRSPHDKKNPYVMINKDMLRDPDLLPRAKGLLCYLLSFHDHWKVIPEVVSKDLNISIDVVYAILKEIIDGGYACRTVEREAGKFKSWNYYFSEYKASTKQSEPFPGNDKMADNDSEPFWQKPELDKPELVKPEMAHIHSDNDISKKQQPLTPSNEKHVVVASDQKQKIRELMERLLAPLSIIDVAMDLPLSQVENAVMCYHQKLQAGKLSSPMGYLRRALENNWQPNVEIDKIEENEVLTVEQLENNKKIALEMAIEFYSKKNKFPGKNIFTDISGIIFQQFRSGKEIKVYFNQNDFTTEIESSKIAFIGWSDD